MPKQNSTLIVQAEFIALDSSILGHLSEDYFASDTASRKVAANFLDCLVGNAFIPFLCWHHFDLACLSPYVNLIYVDKRMKNDFERSSRERDSVFCKLLNSVRIEKVRPYKKLQEQIEAIAE
jgi:hypothetical protein